MVKKLTLLVYILLILMMGTATVVEALRGTDFVEAAVYHALYFCGLWGALSLLSVVLMVRYELWKRFPTFLLHASLLVILLGALTTFVAGKKGYVHLRSGVATGTFTMMDHETVEPLPFEVRLDSFRVEYYPGTKAPKDYVSYLTARKGGQPEEQVQVSMNRIWISQGYRFYQTSFDEDTQGSFLTVNYDPWGTGITYAGYILLALSMLGVLLSPRGPFLRLLRAQLASSGRGRSGGSRSAMLPLLLVGLTLVPPTAAHALPRTALPVVRKAQADSLSRLQVIYNDRVTPFNTLARDFVLKVYGAPAYKGLTPEQVLGSWVLYPERWKQEPVIYVKSGALRQLLGLRGDYACLLDLFDGETYRLQEHYGKGNRKLDQAIWEIDEKVGLISMLLQGTLIRPIAGDPAIQPLSATKVNAELLYNRVPFSKLLFMFNLTAGLLGLAYLLYEYLRKTPSGKYDRTVHRTLAGVLYLTTFVHAFSYALHGYIAGHLPLGNGYETMLFMALVLLVLAGLLQRKYPFAAPFGLLLSGFSLLVAYLGQRNPQITPLMPVLLSPWLSSHVSLIMMSYALLGFNMLNGILGLCLMHAARIPGAGRQRHLRRLHQLTQLSRLLLYPAVFFLGIGIFLGAVWANESWGRYWAWDPKEVWALITFMVYGAAFHLQSVPVFRRPRFYHTYMVLAFLTVLMTYFGVNYVLGGMHSYA